MIKTNRNSPDILRPAIYPLLLTFLPFLKPNMKNANKELAKERIYIEHTNSWIKRFKILSTKFRNNLKYFASFAVLICALFNLDIT